MDSLGFSFTGLSSRGLRFKRKIVKLRVQDTKFSYHFTLSNRLFTVLFQLPRAQFATIGPSGFLSYGRLKTSNIIILTIISSLTLGLGLDLLQFKSPIAVMIGLFRLLFQLQIFSQDQRLDSLGFSFTGVSSRALLFEISNFTLCSIIFVE